MERARRGGQGTHYLASIAPSDSPTASCVIFSIAAACLRLFSARRRRRVYRATIRENTKDRAGRVWAQGGGGGGGEGRWIYTESSPGRWG